MRRVNSPGDIEWLLQGREGVTRDLNKAGRFPLNKAMEIAEEFRWLFVPLAVKDLLELKKETVVNYCANRKVLLEKSNQFSHSCNP